MATLGSHKVISQAPPTQTLKSVAPTTNAETVLPTSHQEEKVKSVHTELESHREIPRTPPRVHVPQSTTLPRMSRLLPNKTLKVPQSTQSPDIHVTPHFPIPRSPAESLRIESVQLSPKRGPSYTPTRTTVPVHPLSFSTSARPSLTYPNPLPRSAGSQLLLGSCSHSPYPTIQDRQAAVPAAPFVVKEIGNVDVSPVLSMLV